MAESTAELARQWFEGVWRSRDDATLKAMLSEDVVAHAPYGQISYEDFLGMHSALIAAMPDYELAIESIMADGDEAVVRWMVTATHSDAPFLAIEPRGAKLNFRGMSWMRFENDQIVEGWDCWDLGGVMHTMADG